MHQGYIHVHLKRGWLKPSHTVTGEQEGVKIGKNSVMYFVNGPKRNTAILLRRYSYILFLIISYVSSRIQ